jgi:hypothetical protein
LVSGSIGILSRLNLTFEQGSPSSKVRLSQDRTPMEPLTKGLSGFSGFLRSGFSPFLGFGIFTFGIVSFGKRSWRPASLFPFSCMTFLICQIKSQCYHRFYLSLTIGATTLVIGMFLGLSDICMLGRSLPKCSTL